MKIHLDLDCYFVSAERVRYPFLQNLPVAVAKSGDNKIFDIKTKKRSVMLGDSGAFNSALEFANETNFSASDSNIILNMWKNEFIDKTKTPHNIHGMVIAKSYEAKPFGITTGMSIAEALYRCPKLIIIPSDHLYYQLMSQKLKEYLITKIPVLEQYSIDEFFGDLGGWIKDEDTFEFIKNLQSQIKSIFNLPISIAASKSKWIAKLATDKIKPYGIKVIKEDEVEEFTDNVKVDEFAGIGRQISKMLHSRGAYTLADAKKIPLAFERYGKTGRELFQKISGTDNDKVVPYSDRRSIGISRNFVAISDRSEVYRRISILSRYLSYQILKLKLNPTTFSFKLKYEYNIKHKTSVTQDMLFSEQNLSKLAKKIFHQLDIHKSWPIHYLSITASNFVNQSNQKTLNLLTYNQDIKSQNLSNSLNKLRDKFGIDCVRWGSEE